MQSMHAALYRLFAESMDGRRGGRPRRVIRESRDSLSSIEAAAAGDPAKIDRATILFPLMAMLKDVFSVHLYQIGSPAIATLAKDRPGARREGGRLGKEGG